jgi:hypothetical protein
MGLPKDFKLKQKRRRRDLGTRNSQHVASPGVK